MKMRFMDKEFLLKTDVARELYHSYAVKMAIIDYHCHIDPKEIYEDIKFDNLSEVWLSADHYKWRVMRAAGISEEYITGNASLHDKFLKYAYVMPRLIGNPLYHWSHLELKRYFNIDEPLNEKNADKIWHKANNKLQDYSARKFIEKSNVEALCTTDDPVDDLIWHKKIKEDETFNCKVLPTYRPDKALNIESLDFTDYIKQLGKCTGITIDSLDKLKEALIIRLDFFKAHGCCVSDHGIATIPHNAENESPDLAFKNALDNKKLTISMAESYRMELLTFLAGEYRKRDIVMQLHFGVIRNLNTSSYKMLGADSGFDAIRGYQEALGERLSTLLNRIELNSGLPKMIVYSLNPLDNAQISVVLGCFQSAEFPAKIQHGSAWWFNDTKCGMEQQLINLAETSVLPYFVGMLTDSRSFLSYTRHEYFRRILCNLIGQWVTDGEYPYDIKFLRKMVEDICYYNCKKYFDF